MNRNASKGFTLIELLVVIAIIGLLASIVLASLNSARLKSRDSRRLADLKQLQNALEMYSSDNGGRYPNQATQASASTSLAVLVTGGYIGAIPSDPLPAGTAYQYRSNSASNSTAYCLGANMEGTPPSPAFACSAATDITTANIDYETGAN